MNFRTSASLTLPISCLYTFLFEKGCGWDLPTSTQAVETFETESWPRIVHKMTNKLHPITISPSQEAMENIGPYGISWNTSEIFTVTSSLVSICPIRIWGMRSLTHSSPSSSMTTGKSSGTGNLPFHPQKCNANRALFHSFFLSS
jgi:hypothetical protein